MDNEIKDLQGIKNQILAEVNELAKAEYEMARLKVVDKTSHLVGSLLLIVCLILIAFAVLAFCAAAAVFALAQAMPTWAACLIMGAAYFLLIPILFVFAKSLFVNPIIKKLSGIKDFRELECETLRAEGRVAVQRERMNGRIRYAQTMYNRYVQLAQLAWTFIRGLFRK